MLGSKSSSLSQFKNLTLHVVIGVLISYVKVLAFVYFFSIVVYFTFQIIKQRHKGYYAIAGAAYIASAEVFLRMTNAMPFWETGKYLVIFFMFLGMFYEGFKRKAWPMLIFLLLLMPGVLVAYFNFEFYDDSFRKTILFNLSGPFSLFATGLFCYQKNFKFYNLMKVIDLMILPVLAMTIYIILYSPSVEEIVFTTESNQVTSGGFSGNQVATVLGLGMFLTYVRFLIPYKNNLLNIINICILSLLSYRCLLTFSRGGFIASILMMMIFTVIFFYWSPLVKTSKAFLKLALLGSVGFILWGVAVGVTDGLIINRYTGKNAKGEDKDITTGRVDIIFEELQAFSKDPFLGVGVGVGKFIRIEEGGQHAASHNEVTRMIAEHGLLGIIAISLLIVTPFVFLLSRNRNLLMLPFVAFWFLTINHSAMRIALPGFMYGFALLTITYASKQKEKNKIKTTLVPR